MQLNISQFKWISKTSANYNIFLEMTFLKCYFLLIVIFLSLLKNQHKKALINFMMREKHYCEVKNWK